MMRFCEGLPFAVFPFLTTQEIVNLSCTCKTLHQVELPDGFWKRRVEYAAQVSATTRVLLRLRQLRRKREASVDHGQTCWFGCVSVCEQLQTTLPEWLQFIRSPSHGAIACYLEKTRTRWRRGQFQHTIYDGHVVPYNLRSFCIHWTITPDKVRSSSTRSCGRAAFLTLLVLAW